ncbi:hypothetical protein MCOR27_001718 [Pyricularia oryzae]|uniref:DUF7707 domain-containing protein n=5 Tax=Pyricularia TaxID=48558 RepID=A0ABQ8NNU7_PYRGI|nr:uncharacterized protein MGG_10824 [Pyricularia oryzae 70-15]ELQ33269.1 hypothetical protein OOU_Y34scaffold00979g53 [Pyricularia oryzae Y34]KAH8837638.1 hypothetical protein MCOR01_011243 [Pyricularia oryzae]KAI6299941.1 hypothetical protein MCOR33_004227 [Pyricularia grisea]EHA53634.1 hypothetical protein MGG_10824 [Pyricularia oryzae 70-15]KAH9437675.1 hypothetical protein MCOR02_001329 [Pyricularia oryzae]
MLSNFAILACSALIPVVTAQLPPLPFNMSYTPDLSPAKVTLAQKAEWCRGETIVCDKLCGAPSQIPKTNDCSSDTLAFSCICQNGTAPGLQYYQNSLPSFICEETFKQCEAARAGDANGQKDCKTGVQSKCGTQSADKATSGGSNGATTTTDSTPRATQGGNSQGGATSSTQPASAATQVPQFIGMAAAAAVMGAFAL